MFLNAECHVKFMGTLHKPHIDYWVWVPSPSAQIWLKGAGKNLLLTLNHPLKTKKKSRIIYYLKTGVYVSMDPQGLKHQS